MPIRTVLSLLFLAAPLGAQVQVPGLPPAPQVYRIRSAILGEVRTIIVQPPPPAATLPAPAVVLYLLDGDGHFDHVRGIVDFLSSNGRLPPALIVAVTNTDRTRDLTPQLIRTPAAERARDGHGGGSEQFAAFLERELVPFIDSVYPTLPFRVLIGHSLGGLFNAEMLARHPKVFQAHIAIDPSLWWDHEASVDRLAKAMHSGAVSRPTFLYLVSANSGSEMLSAARRAVDSLQHPAPDLLRFWYRYLPDEDHGSVVHRAVYDGLETIFREYRLPPDSLAQTMNVAAVDGWFARLSQYYGVTFGTPEFALNRLGMTVLRAHPETGLAMLQANIRRFPKSANTFDTMGDALQQLGRLTEARAEYQKAIAMANRTGAIIGPVSQAKLAELEKRIGGK
ncbi:MAG: alpha/beta hydrolase-fold protein [Gemmatimonadota bacterium]